MVSTIDKLTASGCSTDDKHKVCRSRGGESCAFDGAMIVLQPIADTAHLVHGPIACCGNSWEGRGALSSRGELHIMGFTTDMNEIDIVYGSEEKLFKAIMATSLAVKPKAVFVYATCVSGLIGEDIEAVCKRAEKELNIRVIAVGSPGFVGPKNLGNRIAGEVLLQHVIGTEEPPVITHYDINLIGEYNIAGDLRQIEPLLASAGIRILSKITGDATFEELTWAHRAKLNVVICSRALINVAYEMERRYGIPFIEASFFGSTEIAKALRGIASMLRVRTGDGDHNVTAVVEDLLKSEERKLGQQLSFYRHLRGKKAVLYTGGVKSWSFISALRDLGIEVAAVGTKKSTYEDEEKMRQLLGAGAVLEENTAPGNLLKLLKERNADMLIAGGRNQYLAAKEGIPFVDVNQERHTAYAGYHGLVNLAEQISNSLCFYGKDSRKVDAGTKGVKRTSAFMQNPDVLINPLKHSPAIGAALALQGIDRTLPIIHGAQGCTFLGKVLLTRHFREPIALAGSKLFVEDVVMGSEEKLEKTIGDFAKKNIPDLIGVLSTGMSEVKGDHIEAVVKKAQRGSLARIVSIKVPDFDGGLETGYARAIVAVIDAIPGREKRPAGDRNKGLTGKSINVLAGAHLTPADFGEIREFAESFGLKPLFLPDLSALDGSRLGFSPLAAGGTSLRELEKMPDAVFTLAIGISMTGPAKQLERKFGIPFSVIESLSGLEDMDRFLALLSSISRGHVPYHYDRQRKILVDTMRDAHEIWSGKAVCLALEPDHAVQMSRWLVEMGAKVPLAVIPVLSEAADKIAACSVEIGDLFHIKGEFDLLIANSHGKHTAKRLGSAHYETGFPVFNTLGYTSRVSVGYRGTSAMICEAGNLLRSKQQQEQYSRGDIYESRVCKH